MESGMAVMLEEFDFVHNLPEVSSQACTDNGHTPQHKPHWTLQLRLYTYVSYH